jgi:hypothetical protein
MEHCIGALLTRQHAQDICETVGSIPVHIGVHDLKLTGVMAVAHKYFKWSKGLVLAPDDVELRSTNWEEYLPKGEGQHDYDAISDRYFKVLKGKRRFESGSKVLELVLALPYEKYEIAYQRSIEDDEPRQVLAMVDHFAIYFTDMMQL